mmetsp:Transcript_12140/g.18341  ORF Transcript_12140/g.18341 Transcript_12140/m.18341 type:complete len:122 (-) Transcript_12140:37-402(-)
MSRLCRRLLFYRRPPMAVKAKASLSCAFTCPSKPALANQCRIRIKQAWKDHLTKHNLMLCTKPISMISASARSSIVMMTLSHCPSGLIMSLVLVMSLQTSLEVQFRILMFEDSRMARATAK